MVTNYTPEQIALIAESQTIDRSENWHIQEEVAQRNDILNRTHERVKTVMEFQEMSDAEQVQHLIKIEDEKAALMEMISNLLIDPLTGLNVRRFYEETVPRVIEDRIKQAQVVKELSEYKDDAEQEEVPEVSMLMVDADHFKNINDTYGHAGGDFVLRELGRIINQLFRKRDIKARYGGEELAIVMPSCDLETAREKAELLRRTIEEHEFVFYTHGSDPVTIKPVRVSIGVGGLNLLKEKGSANDLTKILHKRADALVYAAKDLGRNTVVSQDAVDMEKLLKRKAKEEGESLPTTTTTTAKSSTRETSRESTSSAPSA